MFKNYKTESWIVDIELKIYKYIYNFVFFSVFQHLYKAQRVDCKAQKTPSARYKPPGRPCRAVSQACFSWLKLELKRMANEWFMHGW